MRFLSQLIHEGLLPHQSFSGWFTAVTSHAAVNSDARSIQISSQNIRIRRQASMQAAAVQMCNKAKLSEPSSINGLHIHMGLG